MPGQFASQVVDNCTADKSAYQIAAPVMDMAAVVVVSAMVTVSPVSVPVPVSLPVTITAMMSVVRPVSLLESVSVLVTIAVLPARMPSTSIAIVVPRLLIMVKIALLLPVPVSV